VAWTSERTGWKATSGAADLLLADGAEAGDVIETALDAGSHPAIIHYEWSEMPPERRCALKRRLLDEGYRFIDVGADTVALRQDA